jgi:hypothetical protein
MKESGVAKAEDRMRNTREPIREYVYKEALTRLHGCAVNMDAVSLQWCHFEIKKEAECRHFTRFSSLVQKYSSFRGEYRCNT